MIPFLTYVASRPKDGYGNPVRAQAIALILESDDSAWIETTRDFKEWAAGLERDVYVEACCLFNEWHVMEVDGTQVYSKAKGWL